MAKRDFGLQVPTYIRVLAAKRPWGTTGNTTQKYYTKKEEDDLKERKETRKFFEFFPRDALHGKTSLDL